MGTLTPAGQQVLSDKNFISHTRIYVGDLLQVDTSTGITDAPVISYQINRSRKLGAAKLSLNVANPGGIYSFKRQVSPIFGYGNKIKLQEGLPVGGTIEWFTRFTGIIISQAPSNMGGKASLSVKAMDNMKLLLDYLPDELYYRPDVVLIKNEILNAVEGGNYTHFRGNQDNLPWVDIPYPVFYKDGQKIKENYQIDLINGEVYFGEKMYGSRTFEATPISENQYRIEKPIQGKYTVSRSFQLNGYEGSVYFQHNFENNEIPSDITKTYSGNEITFSKSPFSDLIQTATQWYTNMKIYITTEVPDSPNEVTVDYCYYDDNTNLAEAVIKDLALKAGFKEEQIILEATNISLKPLRFTNLTIKNGFEALQTIKQQLSPNYIVTCDTGGNLRGYYASQKVVSDYDLQLIKRIEAPVSEENLYSVLVAHGVDLNPNDIRSLATAYNLLHPNSIISVEGSADMVLNKKPDDQITWHWIKKNDDKPPTLPVDLMSIVWSHPKKVEEINILVGDYKGGTIEQTISVQVTEDGNNWFYIDRSSRGLAGASSQWLSVKGGELENRKIRGLKLIAEAGFNWTESHAYSKGGFFSKRVVTDYFYHWYLAIKEIQIWEENTIAVTSSLCNCIGIGDGIQDKFSIPNTPIVPGTVKIYNDGVELGESGYTVDCATGQVKFLIPPSDVLFADYTVETKQQPRTQSSNDDRFANNVTVFNPQVTVDFKVNWDKVSEAEYILLRKIGLKKNALKTDNYLNSFGDVKTRGEEMLSEISRLLETLDLEVIYRPDIDICQTIGVYDDLLGLTGCYFVEEITESKQGYRPSLNVKVSKYSN